MRFAHPISKEISVGVCLIMLTALLISAPFILSFLKIGGKTIFGCFAPDAMYYHAIAKNTVAHGFITFNQETVTNGFQPLWQYILIFFVWSLKATLENILFLGFGLNLGLVIIGFTAAVLGARAYLGLRAASFMPFLLLPGAFTLFFEPSLGHFSEDPALLYSFSSWAFVNGMESGISIAAYGLFLMTILIRLARAEKNATGIEIISFWPSICLSVIVLARLDDVFLLCSISISILLFENVSISRRIISVIRIMFPSVLLILLYIVFNKVTVGAYLPISGLHKTGFAFYSNLQKGFDLLRDFPPAFASRMLPMIVFMFTGAILFGYTAFDLYREPNRKEPSDRNFKKYLIIPLSGYLFLKAAFHFSAVNMWDQGWWYYTGQIFVFNFLLGLFFGRVLASRTRTLIYSLSLSLASLITMVQVVDTGHRITNLSGYAKTFAELWEHRESLNANLEAIDPDMKMIDNTDGMYGLILNMHVGSGRGLVFSPDEMQEAAEKGRFRALVDRGFNVIPNLRNGSWQGHYTNPEKLDIRAVPIHVDKVTGVVFYVLGSSGPDD